MTSARGLTACSTVEFASSNDRRPSHCRVHTGWTVAGRSSATAVGAAVPLALPTRYTESKKCNPQPKLHHHLTITTLHACMHIPQTFVQFLPVPLDASSTPQFSHISVKWNRTEAVAGVRLTGWECALNRPVPKTTGDGRQQFLNSGSCEKWPLNDAHNVRQLA